MCLSQSSQFLRPPEASVAVLADVRLCVVSWCIKNMPLFEYKLNVRISILTEICYFKQTDVYIQIYRVKILQYSCALITIMR